MTRVKKILSRAVIVLILILGGYWIINPSFLDFIKTDVSQDTSPATDTGGFGIPGTGCGSIITALSNLRDLWLKGDYVNVGLHLEPSQTLNFVHNSRAAIAFSVKDNANYAVTLKTDFPVGDPTASIELKLSLPRAQTTSQWEASDSSVIPVFPAEQSGRFPVFFTTASVGKVVTISGTDETTGQTYSLEITIQ